MMSSQKKKSIQIILRTIQLKKKILSFDSKMLTLKMSTSQKKINYKLNVSLFDVIN